MLCVKKKMTRESGYMHEQKCGKHNMMLRERKKYKIYSTDSVHITHTHTYTHTHTHIYTHTHICIPG